MVGCGIGLLGCGVVGSAVVRGLAELPLTAAMSVRRVGVRDITLSRDCALAPGVLTAHALDVVEDPAVDIVVEAIGGEEPAQALIARALQLGKPVVTANKAVLAAWGPQLRRHADEAGVPLLFEAAVGGAIPVIRGLSGLLRVDEITKIEAVLNGTTTFILSHVERTGASIDAALAEARRLGYAEADASRDLDGSDSADKLAVLVQYLFGEELRTGDIHRLGIDVLDHADITAGDGRSWRLLATAVRGGCARVEPVALPAEHPFARLEGPQNAVTVVGTRSGAITLTGAGAGGDATACSVIADVLTARDWLCGPHVDTAWPAAL